MKVHTKLIKAFGALLIAALLFAALPAGTAKAQTTITVCPGGGCDYTSIQAAIDAVEAAVVTEATTFVIDVALGEYVENLVVTKITDEKSYEILGAEGTTLKGTVNIYSNSAYYDSTLLIKGINFVDNTPTVGNAFIKFGNDGATRYASNVTIEDCTFTGTDQLDWGIEPISGSGVMNILIKNCDLIDMHSLAQISSVGITIEGCTFTNTARGMNLNASTGIMIKDTIFNGPVPKYAVRVGQSSGTPTNQTLTITDSTLLSSGSSEDLTDPETVLVLRGDAPKNIVITDSTISNTAGDCDITLDSDGANPTLYTLTFNNVDWGTDGMKLCGLEGATIINNTVHNVTQDTWHATIQAAIDAASDSDTINVAAGTYPEDIIVTDKYFNLIGEVDVNGDPLSILQGSLSIDNPSFMVEFTKIENIYFDASTNHLLILKNFNGGLIKNCIFDGNDRFVTTPVINGINLISGPNGNSNITVEDSLFKDGLYVGIGGYANGITVKASKFTNVKSGINHQGGGGNLVVQDSYFKNKPVTTTDSYGIRFASSSGDTPNMSITGSTFEMDLSGGFTADPDEYHVSIYVRAGATGTLEVGESTILGGVANLSTIQLDASPNWWGSILGPQGPVTGGVVYSPWCGDAACSFLVYDTPQTNGIYVEGGEVVVSGSVSVPGGIIANEPGVKYNITQGTTIQNDSPCFVVNADDVQIIGEYPGEETCIPTSDSAGIEVADGVQGLQVVNLKFDGSQTTHTTAIDFAGGVDGFQILNNYFDGFATAIAFGGTVTNTYDDYFIQGNMFKGATIVPGTNSINAEYNSWGVNTAPVIAGVDTDPFTHADLWVETDYALYSGNQIAAGESITYTVFANLTEISGAEFRLNYPSALLTLTSTTDGTDFVGIPDGLGGTEALLDKSVAGQITFRGTLPVSGTPVTDTDVVLFTATFDVVGTVPTPSSGMLELIELSSQGFSMTPSVESYTNHVYPVALTDADLTVIDLPTISADGIEGYYLVDETREFTVTVDNPATGGDFAHVLFRFEVTADAADVTLFNYWDAATSTWLPMPLDCTTTPGTCVGYYGPSTGFPIDDGYTTTSTFQVEFAADGEYPFTITLVDLDAASKVLDTYTNTAVVYTVPMITSTDITGPYQATVPQAFNLTVTVDPDMVGAVVFELEFDFPDGTVISYGGMDYTCTATGCPLIPVTLVGGANTLPFTVTFPAGYIGDVTVSLFDTGWTPDDRLLASETFDLIVYGNFAVDGKVMMQGRYSRGGVPMTLTGLEVLGYGPYPTTSLDKLGQNLFFTDVAEGYYVVTTGQDRYLNVPGAMLVVNNTMTLPDLYLYGGNANNDDAIGIGDASVVGGAYGIGDILSDGDVNFDNRVNIQDLALVGGNYNLTDAIYDDWMIPYDVQGQVTADELGHVTGSLTGTYNITIDGQVTDYVNNQATFTGTVSGAISGTVTATINENGTGTMFGTLIEDVTLEEFQIMGIFPKSGVNGHFVGTIVQGYAPSVTGIEITAPATTVVEGGTLQMSAVVAPIGAYDRVIWSVWTDPNDPNRGEATIDPITGLLTGVSEGPVTVIVKALDGSLLDDTFAVTVTAH